MLSDYNIQKESTLHSVESQADQHGQSNRTTSLERTARVPEPTVQSGIVQQVLAELKVSSLPISEVLRRRLFDVVRENIDAFAETPTDLGKTSVVIHTIRTSAAKPFKHKLRPIILALRQQLEKEVERLLVVGAISPAYTSRARILREQHSRLSRMARCKCAWTTGTYLPKLRKAHFLCQESIQCGRLRSAIILLHMCRFINLCVIVTILTPSNSVTCHQTADHVSPRQPVAIVTSSIPF